MTVYLKLAGPNTKGLNPKGCYTKGWTDPFYKGVELDAGDWRDYVGWLGMRLDNHIVVDCDNEEAKDLWLKHIGRVAGHTWVRQTPHGYHFIYKRGVDCYGVKAKVPWFLPKVDLKVGPGHLVVLAAPGYRDVSTAHDCTPFNLAWLPAVMETARPVEEWNELSDGQGDSFMISIAGKMRSWGADEEAIQAALAAINPVLMPTKPMPPQSIRRLARSAAKYSTEDSTEVMCPACGASIEVR